MRKNPAVVFKDFIEEVNGKLFGVMFRRKKYYLNGKAVGKGSQERFEQRPRDWKRHPAKGKELAHMKNFAAVCAQTKTIMHDPALRQPWEVRFNAQLHKPEPDAPIDPKTSKPHIYTRIDAFIRAALLREMEK